jgi:ubiquinol-cytochrome c reductase iron-sulfur subunit
MTDERDDIPTGSAHRADSGDVVPAEGQATSGSGARRREIAERFAGSPEEVAHRIEADERAEDARARLSGKTGRDVRRNLVRATVSRQAEERFGEIEEAQRLVLDKPSPVAGSPGDDEEARGAKQVGFWFTLSAVCTLGFLVLYVLSNPHEQLRRQNVLFGLSLGGALLCIGIGAVIWVRRVMPHGDSVQLREDLRPSPEELRSLEIDWAKGVEDSAVTRRKVLLGTLGLSTGLLALPPLFLLRDLGPSPTGASGRSVYTYTAWRRNMRFADYDTELPVKIGQIGVGSLLTVIPEGHSDAAADSAVMLIRLRPEDVRMSYFDAYAARWKNSNFKGTDFVVDGHIAYSKICTHAGCPVSLYQQQFKQFLCPCHQSTFVAYEAGKVIFGPAARALPMLPFYVDDQGYFRSLGDFPEPVGPSFWERG